MRRFICYGLRGVDSWGGTVEVEAKDEDEAMRKASPHLKANADWYVTEEIFESRRPLPEGDQT